MKATHWFVGLALIAVALSSAEAATTFYVDNCGHDTWCNGQSSACWNGLSQSQTCAMKTIQAGMNLASSGDTGDRGTRDVHGERKP